MQQDTYICDACNQVCTIQKQGLMTERRPAWCPVCGAPALRTIRSIVAQGMSGACFKHINPRLVLLLYSEWMQDRAGTAHPTHGRFVDYIRERINNG